MEQVFQRALPLLTSLGIVWITLSILGMILALIVTVIAVISIVLKLWRKP